MSNDCTHQSAIVGLQITSYLNREFYFHDGEIVRMLNRDSTSTPLWFISCQECNTIWSGEDVPDSLGELVAVVENLIKGE